MQHDSQAGILVSPIDAACCMLHKPMRVYKSYIGIPVKSTDAACLKRRHHKVTEMDTTAFTNLSVTPIIPKAIIVTKENGVNNLENHPLQ